MQSQSEVQARSGMYRLLGRLFLLEIDAELLSSLAAPPIHDAFVEAGGILPKSSDTPALNELAIDYCQLFIGPTQHLPPYQSVWESGQLQTETVVSMKTFADIAGYSRPEAQPSVMQDHLGIQLDLMAHLLSQALTMPSGSEEETQVFEIADAYFTTHLRWTSDFLSKAQARATTPLYRSVLGMTASFLESESQSSVR